MDDEPIHDVQGRLRRLLDVLAASVRGEMDARVALLERSDALVDVEVAANMFLDEFLLLRKEIQQQAAALIEKNTELAARDQALIRALSTPIISVWPGVIALPIIGPVDAARQAVIAQALLTRIVADRVRHVILDVTGLSEPDASTIQGFVSTTKAAMLLGAQCVVTGITAELARAMIATDCELTVPTAARLSDVVQDLVQGRSMYFR